MRKKTEKTHKIRISKNRNCVSKYPQKYVTINVPFQNYLDLYYILHYKEVEGFVL